MKRLILCASVVGVMACGGGSSGGNSTPTSPTTPTTPTPPPANRAPVISTMAMTPAFGVANLTTFSFSVSASDPDGDSITTLWDIAGNPFTGTSGQVLFTTGGNGTARVTVNDGKGGTATDSRTFIVGTMTGTWDGFNSSLGAFSMTLTQNGAFFSGTYSDTSPFGQGRTDPAQPGIIRADASLEVRIKQAAFTDFTFRGTMDNTGRRISGGIHGSGFTGQPFVMDKR